LAFVKQDKNVSLISQNIIIINGDVIGQWLQSCVSQRHSSPSPICWHLRCSSVTDHGLHVRTVPATYDISIDAQVSNVQNPLHTFPRNFPVDGEVAKATSGCSGIWETTRHNRHKGLLPAPTCYGLATGKLV